MLLNKLLIIGMLFMSIGTVTAWDSEGGYAEGETFETTWIEGEDYFIYQTPETTNWYDPLIDLWIRINAFLFTDEEIEVEVTTTCMKWDGDSYEPDTSTLPEEYGCTLGIDKNASQDITLVKMDPVEEFFKNNTDAMEDFKTRDDDSEYPDILNVSINISGAGVDIQDYGYTSLDDDDLDGINERINNPDYGFSLDGRGSGGGSGSIYEGIDMYGSSGGDTTGMGASFNTIFWCIIPLIFILAVMKLSSRVLK